MWHSGSAGCLSVLRPVPRLALVLSALGRAGRMDGIVFTAVRSHSSPGGGNVREQRREDRAWLPGEGRCPGLPVSTIWEGGMAGPRAGRSPWLAGSQLVPLPSFPAAAAGVSTWRGEEGKLFSKGGVPAGIRGRALGVTRSASPMSVSWDPWKSSWGDEECQSYVRQLGSLEELLG
ncbi:hypothetical protein DUI87_16714 [Hirundo rustica rustica]|uniref:Uncharacterized protein n=1 Tax=Hirundo rustica rustica TaxID=333673 RepID=A0A3M0KJ92_HIRRU|nr:hypothetical protein DUI87_16714 [Hirundo rustica rustica]